MNKITGVPLNQVPHLLTPKQIATEVYDLSDPDEIRRKAHSLWRSARDRRLPCTKVGNRTFFDPSNFKPQLQTQELPKKRTEEITPSTQQVSIFREVVRGLL